MMLENLRNEVFEANKMLPTMELVKLTWGNVSGIDRETGLVVIKPSGVEYDQLTPEDLVVVDLGGNVIEGQLKPSSDLPTHLVIYKAFENVGGVTHTHSEWATIWAQSGLNLPAYGTTHADYFNGEIPCSRPLNEKEINSDYEKETGNIIIETFKKYNYINTPGVLVKSHGPFTWGKTPTEAVENAAVLEEVAMISLGTLNINSKQKGISQILLDKHYFRKHGKDAYYGQK